MTGFRECRLTAQDGLSLYYRDYGDPDASALPVLCLTGLTRNSRDFHRLAGRLGATRRVICLDYRGRGRSDHDPNPHNYQPSTYLSDIRHLLAATGLHRAIFIGTSLGGLLSMATGAAMPTVPAGIVLNDVGPELNTGGLSRIAAYVRQNRPHRNWDDAIADLQARLHLSVKTPEEWREVAEGTWREGPDGMLHFDWDLKVSTPIVEGRPLPDLWPLFRSIAHVPTLALRGARSDVLTAEAFARMADAHPDLTQVTVPDAGHTPTLTEPPSTEAIDAFLARIDEAAGAPA
ncbi:MAG: alpha/beta fold hydrolase [Alphaproteobacteria bacterium]